MGATLAITFADVQSAAERLRDTAERTPVATSRTLNERLGAEIFCKCENLQRAGSFKFRGAYNAVSRLTQAQRKVGVVGFSSGNYAQALALAGKLLGTPVVMVMPRDAPAVKLAATKGYGAEVVLYERAEENRAAIARRLVDERGLTLIPPFDHPHVIAGQGTAALELMNEVPGLDLLVVPIGGGGLISGCAVAAHAILPSTRVVGVEPDTADDTRQSLARGEIVTTPQSHSIMDGLLPTAPGKLTFPIIREHVKQVVVVSDFESAEALQFLVLRMKLVVEPSGAAGLAALLAGRVADVAGKRVGVILSGGNVDGGMLARMLTRPGTS
jgi:threonine dehydratase